MNIKYITSGLLTAMIMSSTACLISCADELEVGKNIDESAYSGIYENNAYLRDGKSNQVSKVVELYGETYTATIKMGLSKAPNTAISAKVKMDAAYLETYNKAHNTDFALYPQDLVTFANEGVLAVNANTKSAEVEMTIRAGEGVQEDKTYVIPVVISDQSSDITIEDEDAKRCIYLVKDMRNASDAYKGEDVVKGCLYFEVNDVNPLNTLSFKLENGKLLWDVIVLFAANINYDAAAQRPSIKCNPNVQYLLDNNEIYLQPLRRRGVKVLLGLLGNHDITGLAQLSKQGAKDFAREVAAFCKAYNLDGVNYDDEYSDNPDLSNPALAPVSAEAGARLCYETKKAMPDKMVSVYVFGSMYGVSKVDGVDASEWLDFVVGDYGLSSYVDPIGNMTRKQCSGLSMQFYSGQSMDLDVPEARKLLAGGFGWYMGFAAHPKFYPDILKRLTGTEVLYGSSVKNPIVFYKKNDPNPYKYPDDFK